MLDCKSCETQSWRQLYLESQKKIDETIVKVTIGIIVLFALLLACLTTTAILVVKTQKFIDEFEYVEETEVHIEQDNRGKNTVVFQDESEVNTDGSGIYREEKEILEKEERQKVNSIIINK